MAYEAENIVYSQKIFYYLLCHGALSDADSGVNELYRAYVENEEVLHLVKSLSLIHILREFTNGKIREIFIK